ncbi:2-amino-4-hydroxy-6-hydroxymethyldihydropteridine diphosphokinase [Lunatibacter salilacus]|uniref:2-amino-4-hydroxy-6- hydroxymethyldihydropteridine diphosphokinase n=1 Tax=Lunatibacter salilacus TaxID=2483804 RepID=UPI00131CC071|nr:2-amino-4-hydroxy-6-hydroxymethyldihydropteridine diphosphokinase [Lunatibacter salilacus]
MENHQVVLLIGGNMGNRLNYLTQAVMQLEEHFKLIKKSGIYETEAWGGNSFGNYLNQALLMQTEANAVQVLELIQEIEHNLDRKREKRWGNRTMDIDILYFDNVVMDTTYLNIPHPYLQERKFVLVPLVEIIPEYVHPIYKVSQLELLARVKDASVVKKWPESTTS